MLSFSCPWIQATLAMAPLASCELTLDHMMPTTLVVISLMTILRATSDPPTLARRSPSSVIHVVG